MRQVLTYSTLLCFTLTVLCFDLNQEEQRQKLGQADVERGTLDLCLYVNMVYSISYTTQRYNLTTHV